MLSILSAKNLNIVWFAAINREHESASVEMIGCFKRLSY